MSNELASRETIFTKIVSGEIPAEKIYEDELTLAFKDIHPVAPTHLLVIPKKPYRDLLEVDPQTLTALLETIKNVASIVGLDKSGFRVVVNNGAAAGQTVFHLHFHLISGRPLNWPPG
jgi:histidine triad (HIT) family protein